ncbi:DUF3325 family protein [Novosphingobium sediminicola]|uniref:DUF3325 domain-containing protein n=1 Tax=Novosphingobium sediminicola TaxID=563162 RepID=A0A7W6CLA0_9SPHN|nr:DUF3325 family protein [Novosphingobium sediminicola]MBB3957555.1 hypothetical protein [Novosphingobium sediminicola]
MTLLLILGGLLCLCLSMTRHQRDLLAHALPKRSSQALRCCGWAALCLSLALAVSDGPLAILCWIGELSIAALIVAASCTLASARRP